MEIPRHHIQELSGLYAAVCDLQAAHAEAGGFGERLQAARYDLCVAAARLDPEYVRQVDGSPASTDCRPAIYHSVCRDLTEALASTAAAQQEARDLQRQETSQRTGIPVHRLA